MDQQGTYKVLLIPEAVVCTHIFLEGYEMIEYGSVEYARALLPIESDRDIVDEVYEQFAMLLTTAALYDLMCRGALPNELPRVTTEIFIEQTIT